MATKTQQDRITVLHALGRVLDADDHEIHKIAKHTLNVYMTPSGARTRRSELVRDGFVAPSTRTSLSPTGRVCKRWRLTEAGERAVTNHRVRVVTS